MTQQKPGYDVPANASPTIMSHFDRAIRDGTLQPTVPSSDEEIDCIPEKPEEPQDPIPANTAAASRTAPRQVIEVNF